MFDGVGINRPPFHWALVGFCFKQYLETKQRKSEELFLGILPQRLSWPTPPKLDRPGIY
jgi:hypothetical protein